MNNAISPYTWPGLYSAIPPSPDRIIEHVCDELKMPREVMSRQVRTRRIVRARWMCWTLIRLHCPNLSLRDMGSMFGTFDHTTVLHGLTALRNDMAQEAELKGQYVRINRRVINNL